MRSALLAVTAVAFALTPLASSHGADLSPVGTWRTFNDVGRETGAVTISEDGGVLSGSIAAIDDPAKAGATCRKCTDDRKDKPVLGMQIIRGVRADGDQWDGGEILDPENGKVYRVKMHMADGGAKLVLRGFIGVSLFGRSQTWVRAG